MLPVGHIAYTWAAFGLLQQRTSAFEKADYRLLAVAALLPDLIDKPLSLLVFTEARTSQGLAHTLLGHLLLLATVALLWRGGLAYALACNGHLLADQMWKHPHTLFFPLLGWQFESWRFMGSPGAMLSAYADIIFRPEVVVLEVIGLGLLVWLVMRHRLYTGGHLKRFLLSGRLPEASSLSSSGCPRARAIRHLRKGS